MKLKDIKPTETAEYRKKSEYGQWKIEELNNQINEQKEYLKMVKANISKLMRKKKKLFETNIEDIEIEQLPKLIR